MTPEVQLWRAVVNQAFMDSTTRPPVVIQSFKAWIIGRRKRLTKKGKAQESEIGERASYSRYVKNCHALLALSEREALQARKWLLENSADFAAVCGYADYDPAYITRAAQKLESQGWKAAA
jgi:hypothetical protein